MDLFVSIDGYTPSDESEENPMGFGWGQITEAYTATRTFRANIFGDASGAGTTGVDESYAAAFFDGVGAEIMGAAMFGLHTFPDDPNWKGWWDENPPFHTPVYVLTHTAPRPSIPMEGGTTFHFITEGIHAALERAKDAAQGKDIRVGGGMATIRQYLSAGLLDEVHLAITPSLLGKGEHLLAGIDTVSLGYKCTEHVSTERATHVVLTK